MDDIRSILKRAARRLFVIDLLSTLVFSAFVALCVLVGLRITQKLLPTFEIDWVLAGLIGLCATLAGALVASLIRKPNQDQVARTIDERAGLRESLSTALCVDTNQDSWSKAIVGDASDRARRVIIKDTLPIEAPRRSYLPLVAGVALLGIWWVPGTDVMGLLAKEEQKQTNLAQIEEVRAEVKNTKDLIEKIKAETGLEAQNEDAQTAPELTPESMEMVDPQEIARSAIKELTSLSDKLQAERNSEEGAAFDAIKDMTRQLSAPEEGPMTEMARAMARGDFSQAQNELEKMAEAIENGEMSEEQKEQAAQQLEQMKQQLESLAQDREALEEQLKAAGLSAEQAQQLATDPAALQQALQDAGMSESQAQQLSQAAQAQQQASDAASSMAQAMGQMAQGMQESNSSQMTEGMGSMSDQLSDMEMLQQEMNALEAAMGQCNSQIAALGQSTNPNGSFGMMGQGIGQSAIDKEFGLTNDPPPGDYMLQKEKANVNASSGGPIIASTMVQGTQIKGESTATFQDAVKSASTQAAEAIETKRVPRKHENAVQHYFGQLDNEAKKASGEPTQPAQQGSDAQSQSQSQSTSENKDGV